MLQIMGHLLRIIRLDQIQYLLDQLPGQLPDLFGDLRLEVEHGCRRDFRPHELQHDLLHRFDDGPPTVVRFAGESPS